jgi:hypothetical protein
MRRLRQFTCVCVCVCVCVLGGGGTTEFTACKFDARILSNLEFFSKKSVVKST